jgi:hypothetical protein
VVVTVAPPLAADQLVLDKLTARAESWITTTVVDAPPPVIVTRADLRDVVVFSEAVTVRTAPDAWAPVGETRSHEALDVAVQVPPLAVTADSSRLAPSAEATHKSNDGVTLAAPAAWVTAKERLAVPAVTVTVAVRAAIVGLASTLNAMIRPVEPLVCDTDTHGWLDWAVHPAWLVVTVTAKAAWAAGADHDVGDRVTEGEGAAAWVTLTVRVTAPARTVIVAVRRAPGLASAAQIISSPDTPDVGESVTHSASAVADQVGWFVVTVGVTVAPPDDGAHVACDVVTVAAP